MGSRKKPRFYDFIRDNNSVIADQDNMYNPGDLVLIADRQTIKAITEVLETPKPVTDNPDLKDKLEAYEIHFEPWVYIAKA